MFAPLPDARVCPLTIVAITLFCAVACSPPAPVSAVQASGTAPHGETTSVGVTASKKATLKLNPAWGRCHASFAASPEAEETVASKLARLGTACADATKMQKVAGGAFTGTQAAAGAPQSYTWSAHAGHCYRLYGAAAPSIKSLYLFIKDSAGIVLGQGATGDSGRTALAVLDDGAVCFKEEDEAAAVVSVGDGSGAYALEVWGD